MYSVNIAQSHRVTGNNKETLNALPNPPIIYIFHIHTSSPIQPINKHNPHTFPTNNTSTFSLIQFPNLPQCTPPLTHQSIIPQHHQHHPQQ
ncbi:uncharacterized protein BO88DRAFT_224876 [Aspergillus vadensis CBS 113365]|uniref:Uncharacterized protein n=1 Tax=Aspergillus vadensis (strain CBS 113365 / IMI 142717 / IBT 24658) TaxID=1448311 RepID=A0A319AZ85_ASPVC|nr:hypothetical protein BO88DRAFT_224876 [Aspergillus vadensis CBS 113365]PYH63190.1 hypothetical protein BO88DRAFT_224876 [Aspergillus vadensis CBS 113365]